VIEFVRSRKRGRQDARYPARHLASPISVRASDKAGVGNARLLLFDHHYKKQHPASVHPPEPAGRPAIKCGRPAPGTGEPQEPGRNLHSDPSIGSAATDSQGGDVRTARARLDGGIRIRLSVEEGLKCRSNLVQASYTAQGIQGLVGDSASGPGPMCNRQSRRSEETSSVLLCVGRTLIINSGFAQQCYGGGCRFNTSGSGAVRVRTTPLLTVEEVRQGARHQK